MSLALVASGKAPLIAAGINLTVIASLVFGWMRRQHQQFRDIVRAQVCATEKEQEVAILAFQDQLTGLGNRRRFLVALEARQRPAGATLDTTVVMMDLDGFKAVNDTLGHNAGDRLLTEVADRLSRLFPPPAVIARLGGDEFALLLPTGDPETVETALAALQSIFDQPFLVAGEALTMRGSVGASSGPCWPASAATVMRWADLALYESKREDAGIPQVFTAVLEQVAERRRVITHAPDHLDIMARLDVHFQPICLTSTSEVIGYEALARWDHPELGIVSPQELFAAADRAHTAERFTAHLLARALAKAAHWPPHLSLSFNITAEEFGPRLPGIIADCCAVHGFAPECLIIEITETALLRDLDIAVQTIDQLHAMGVRIALDDFGAGFASIGYLKKVRFDFIKLDGDLVASVDECPSARQLLIGVVMLCRSIGTPIVVERVETPEQLALLQLLNVERVQGYLLGAPAAAIGEPMDDLGRAQLSQADNGATVLRLPAPKG